MIHRPLKAETSKGDALKVLSLDANNQTAYHDRVTRTPRSCSIYGLRCGIKMLIPSLV